MFVTRRALVALFIIGFAFCLLVVLIVNPFDVPTNLGATNIFLSPSAADIISTDSETEEEDEDKKPSNTKPENKVIDLAISSPQPSTTLYPHGKKPPAEPQPAEQEVKHKIPDSFQHVKDTKDVLEFVHKQCKKYNRTTAAPGEAKKPRMLLVPKNWREHMMVYASNPKTGSTSFKKWLNRIQGVTKPYAEIGGVHAMGKYGKFGEVFDWVEQDLGREAQLSDAVKDLYKVVAVRNPLTKLMSGFRDKILRRTATGIRAPAMLNINPDLTANSTDAEKYAAFAEAVVTGKIVNVHFTSQWSKMKICDFPYDMIMQTETTNQQIKEVQEHTNTTQYEFPGSRSEQGYDSVATVHLAHEFYSKVRPEVMEKIYKYYRWDFILMGYTKLDNPNFPYLDFNQDIDKEFGYLITEEDRNFGSDLALDDEESPTDDTP